MTRRAWLLLAALAAAVPARDAAAQASFFDSHDVIEATLRADLGALRSDRDTATARWHGATLTWRGPDGPRTVPLRVRTRGIYRLANCLFPPIRLRFAESDVHGTPWEGLRRPKLVTHCVDRAAYEQNLLQEYAIYRVLRLLTPLSYSVRLLRMTYEDSGGAGRPLTRYAFAIEEPDRFAARLGATPLEERDVRLTNLVPSEVALLGVFQYFIANTDWSVPSLHNIELFSLRDTIRAVPYDFDWSGVVAAPYARPAQILPIGSVRERLYRGPCLSRAVLEPVLARFESLRGTIAVLYRSIPGLEAREAEQALRYYDEFYRAIRDRAGFTRGVVERDCLRSRFANPPPGP